MKALRRALSPSWMKVCGMRVPSEFLPALSMKLAMARVQLPIIGTFQFSFSMPLAIWASSGPMP